jgi:hypothetical protein
VWIAERQVIYRSPLPAVVVPDATVPAHILGRRYGKVALLDDGTASRSSSTPACSAAPRS